MEDSLQSWVQPGSRHYAQNLEFALGRFEEGRQLAGFFSQNIVKRPLRLLDIGAGNGGVSLGLANSNDFEVTALDLVPNRELRLLKERTALPIRQVVASGHDLPFPAESFDVVLCLETIEHVPSAAKLGDQIMQVLAPEAYCMITTPPRLRYLLKPDPHFGVKGLLLLPDAVQEFVVTRLAGRRVLNASLESTAYYDVDHIYWSSTGISRLFPGEKHVEVMWNHPYPGPTRFHNWLWSRFRNSLWDRILIRKAATAV